MSRADDGFDILQNLNRYGMAIDDHDWAALETVLAEDAVSVYTFGTDDEPVEIRMDGRSATIEWLATVLADRRGAMRFMANHVIDLDGDRATSRHIMHNRNLSVSGEYRCEHVRTDQGWRISALRLHERVLDADGVDDARDTDPPRPGVVSRIRRLADRAELAELLPRYARLLDQRRWDELGTIFTDDASCDYSSIAGRAASPVGLAAITEWLAGGLGHEREPVPFHYVTDTVVTALDALTARIEASMHTRPIDVVGMYSADAVRTADGWRIARLMLDGERQAGRAGG